VSRLFPLSSKQCPDGFRTGLTGDKIGLVPLGPGSRGPTVMFLNLRGWARRILQGFAVNHKEMGKAPLSIRKQIRETVLREH